MKVLLLHQHMDGLNFPEGKRAAPHIHQWRVEAPTPLDKLGRPYCTVCSAKPSFFELKEVEENSLHYAALLGNGAFVVERDILMEDSEDKVTLRDKFAIEILQAFIINKRDGGTYDSVRTHQEKDAGHIKWSDEKMTDLIRTSYRIADLMRKVRIGVFK